MNLKFWLQVHLTPLKMVCIPTQEHGNEKKPVIANEVRQSPESNRVLNLLNVISTIVEKSPENNRYGMHSHAGAWERENRVL